MELLPAVSLSISPAHLLIHVVVEFGNGRRMPCRGSYHNFNKYIHVLHSQHGYPYSGNQTPNPDSVKVMGPLWIVKCPNFCVLSLTWKTENFIGSRRDEKVLSFENEWWVVCDRISLTERLFNKNEPTWFHVSACSYRLFSESRLPDPPTCRWVDAADWLFVHWVCFRSLTVKWWRLEDWDVTRASRATTSPWNAPQLKGT